MLLVQFMFCLWSVVLVYLFSILIGCGFTRGRIHVEQSIGGKNLVDIKKMFEELEEK